MNQILGLLDSLEAMVLDGKKVPLSEKVILDEKELLQLIDKIRLTVKSEGDNVKKSIGIRDDDGDNVSLEASPQPLSTGPATPDAQAQIHAAQAESEKVRTGANEYADYIMANCQMLINKMQSNLVKMEKTIGDSRHILQTELELKNKKKGDNDETR